MNKKHCLPLSYGVGARTVAAFLMSHGVPVVSLTPRETHIEDDEIDLGGGVHVSVGDGVAVVHSITRDRQAMQWPDRCYASALLWDVAEARALAAAGVEAPLPAA